MRQILILPLLLLSLAGCTSVGTIPIPLPPGSEATVGAVIAGAKQACGFVPLAQSVANIIAKKDTSASTVSQIVSLICGAITSAPMAEGRPVAVRLRNSKTGRLEVVRIRGHFVR